MNAQYAQIEHTDVAAYALGLLEEHDRRAFETHLATCASCAAELAGLTDVAQALAGIPPEMAAPVAETDPAIVTDLVRHRARAQRHRRRSRTLLSAAAGIVLVTGGAAAGAAVAGSQGDSGDKGGQPPPPAVAEGSAQSTQVLLRKGHRLAATDPTSGVTGVVAMEPKRWGSRIAFQISKIRGPLECQLVAVDRTGDGRLVTGWSVPPQGYGFPGAPPALVLEGGTAMRASDIVKFEVRTVQGRKLLTIPA